MNSKLAAGRLKLFAAALGAILIGGGAAAAALVLGQEEDPSPRRAATLVADSHQSVRDIADELSRVATLDDLAAAGRAAEAEAADVVEASETADRLLGGDPALARSVQEVLTADAVALDLVAQTAAIRPRTVERWRAVVADIRRSAAEVSERHRRLPVPPLLRRPEDPGPALVAAVADADAVVRAARRKLAKWHRRLSKALRARREAVAVVDGYRSSMLGYLRDYDDKRTAFSNWIVEVDTGGVMFDEAYEFLDDASASRASVRRGVAALDPPGALAEQHNTLLAVLDSGIAAVDRAYEGVVDYEFDWAREYESYRDTPGWSAFAEQSDAVADRYASARAGWEQAVAKHRKSISDRAMPKAPDV